MVVVDSDLQSLSKDFLRTVDYKGEIRRKVTIGLAISYCVREFQWRVLSYN